MSLANVSTTRLVLNVQRLDTRTTHALRYINVLTVEKKHASTKSAVFLYIKGSMIFNISEYQRMFLFSKLEQFIFKNSWKEGYELCWSH